MIKSFMIKNFLEGDKLFNELLFQESIMKHISIDKGNEEKERKKVGKKGNEKKNQYSNLICEIMEIQMIDQENRLNEKWECDRSEQFISQGEIEFN